ncbi:myelin-oligodendrocyte glycoprotein-like [Alligator mississippiensis]|uniref:myelin-oligodendrocyte glycoprotein-like n=1 Tax=Alligator mississippiensis TaxID=8496 RepID=UPI002877C669|nr:myelin-oligodendrocyte glycoprotein-like [Alligator mississippiensis]
MQREVFSFPTGPKGSPFLPSCIALLAALQIHHPMAAQFRVIGPGQPVVVTMGEDAVLPCHLLPPMSAESMEVRWLQPGFSSYVHLYRGGQDQDGQQMPAYRGRTQLVKDDLSDGSVSLRIRSVRRSDHGLYTCFVQSNDSSGDALLELQVTDAMVQHVAQIDNGVTDYVYNEGKFFQLASSFL